MSKLTQSTHPRTPRPSPLSSGSPRLWTIWGFVLLALLAAFIWLLLHLRNESYRAPVVSETRQVLSPSAKSPSPGLTIHLQGNSEDGLMLIQTPSMEHAGPQPGLEPLPPAEPVPLPSYLKDLKPDDLLTVQDSTPMRPEETRAYYYLAWQAYLLKDTPGAPTTPPLSLQTTGFFEDPAKLRGQPVHVKGDLYSLEVLNLDPNPTGRLRIYQIGILPSDGSPIPIFVLVWKDPGAQEIRLGDTVEGDALFFKIWQFSTDPPRTAPLVMAYSLTRIPPPPNYLPDLVGILLIAVILAAATLLLVSKLLSRRRAADHWRNSAEREYHRELEEFDNQLNQPPS